MLFTFELNNRSKVQSLKQRETTVDFSDEKALAVIEKEKDDIKTELLSIEGMTALDYVTFKGYLDEFPSLIPHVTNTDLIQGVRAAGGSSNFILPIPTTQHFFLLQHSGRDKICCYGRKNELCEKCSSRIVASRDIYPWDT